MFQQNNWFGDYKAKQDFISFSASKLFLVEKKNKMQSESGEEGRDSHALHCNDSILVKAQELSSFLVERK